MTFFQILWPSQNIRTLTSMTSKSLSEDLKKYISWDFPVSPKNSKYSIAFSGYLFLDNLVFKKKELCPRRKVLSLHRRACGHVDVGTCPHQILPATLTLSQPGGQIMPTQYWCPHQVLKATDVPAKVV